MPVTSQEQAMTTLLQTQAFINGQWVNASDEKTFAINNPASGALITSIADANAADATAAIDAAAAALPAWRALMMKERAVIMTRWADLIKANRDELAKLLTAEQGKPLLESHGEIDYALERFHWNIAQACRVMGQVIPQVSDQTQSVTLREAIGVVAAITPWNFPIGMAAAKFSQALTVGCTIIMKPSETTPLTTLALAKLGEQAGIPAGVVNILPSNQPAAIGKILTDSPIVRKLTFTGSTRTGKLLAAQSAATVKSLTLELGGNAPFIVFEDADLERAITALMGMKFYNAGQICVCPNRIIVHESIHDLFVKRIAAAMQSLTVGDGMQENISMGPLNNQVNYDKATALVNDAINKGATVVVGGNKHALGGTFFQPTLLTELSRDMDIAHQEVFAPVIAVYRFTDEAEVLNFANDTDYGLAAYYFTENYQRSWRVGRQLQAGTVACNTTNFGNPGAPFGGYKQSGIGRENGCYGVEAFLEIKHLCFGGLI